MDTIHLQNINVQCILGCFPEERVTRRPVVISVTLFTDISVPARTDDIKDALDYNILTQNIIDFAENSSFKLIEALAENIAQLCLHTTGIREVEVSVSKPNPRPSLENAVITIRRSSQN